VIRASTGCWRAVCRCFEQDLDHPNIDVLLEQMGGKAVPQCMRRHALGNLGHVSRRMASAHSTIDRQPLDRDLSRRR
jgi:hypothetical protein